MNFSKILLIGHLGHDPSLNDLPSGERVCNFSLAVSEKWKNKSGQDVQDTQWFNIHVFGASAEHCKKYLFKGSPVFIEGKVKSRSYTSKTGEIKHSMDVTCSQVRFLGTKDTSSDLPKASVKDNFDKGSVPYGGQDYSKPLQAKKEYDEADIPF